jgi:hypothetical protein
MTLRPSVPMTGRPLMPAAPETSASLILLKLESSL